MSARERNYVQISGQGARTLMFAHGFGCDQSMWRLVVPAFEESYRIVLFDHVGAGRSDLTAFDPAKYSSLQGYADDVIEIIRECDLRKVCLCRSFGQRHDRRIGCDQSSRSF